MNLDKTRLIHDIMIELHFLVVFNMLPQPSAVLALSAVVSENALQPSPLPL